jgi:hypothetical protein
MAALVDGGQEKQTSSGVAEEAPAGDAVARRRRHGTIAVVVIGVAVGAIAGYVLTAALREPTTGEVNRGSPNRPSAEGR